VFNGFDRFVRAATHPRPSRRRRQTLRRIPRFTPPASPTGTFAVRSGRSDPT
jgi:hypothetical protein